MKEKINILVVDDVQINIKVISLFLNELGFTNITTAENGKQAIETFKPDFDLVLLDIGLPDLNGFEVCKLLREKSTNKIPIIAVTANTEDIKNKCKIAGIDDVIQKPVEIYLLDKKIKKWLSL